MSRTWRPENLCSHCACNPCQCHTHEQLWAKGKAAHDERKSKSPKTKKKKKPKKSKSAFIKDLKRRNPTISSSDLKAALRKAGYSSGCLVLLFMFGPVVYIAYEIISRITG